MTLPRVSDIVGFLLTTWIVYRVVSGARHHVTIPGLGVFSSRSPITFRAARFEYGGGRAPAVALPPI